MKNLALALATTLLLAACSSGSTVAPLPISLNGVFTGSFENTDGTQDGTAIFNLSQLANSDEVTGNAVYDTNTINTCLLNATIQDGVNNGASATLTIGNTNFQLAISNDGNTLSGTYVTTDLDTCSNGSGAGSITLTR